MNFLNIEIRENKLYLQSNSEFTNIKKAKINIANLEYIDGYYVLDFKDLKIAPSSKGYSICANEEIDLSTYDVKFNGTSELKYEDDMYYVHISDKNTLRIAKNKLPKLGNYLDKYSINNISTDENGYNFTLNIALKYDVVDHVNFVIKNRKYEHTIKKAIDKAEFKKVGDLFVCEATVHVHKDEIVESLHDLDFNGYDLNIFDYLVDFTLSNHQLAKSSRRLRLEENYDNEVWCKYDEQKMMMLFFYPTKGYQNLSSKITFVTNETYQAYINIDSSATNDKYYLVYEYPEKTQDTGLAFFKYMYDNHYNDKECYYIVRADSPDLKNLNAYKDRIVYYKTPEHMQMFFNAKMLINSHSVNYGFPFNSFKTLEKASKTYKVFLQHGILGVRDMSVLYGRQNFPDFTNLFVVSSDRERKIVLKEFGYAPDEIALTGLSRFDRLFSPENISNYQKREKKNIIIMPTWRAGESGYTDEVFKETEFFKHFDALLKSAEFKKLCEDNNFKVKFYLHTNFQHYTHLFESDFIEIIKEGEKNVQDLIIDNDLMITDYSSVGLDFSLLRKTVLYYQFDQGLENQRNAKFLPGKVITTQFDLLKEVDAFSKNSNMKLIYKLRLKKLYKFQDNKASERIYNLIKDI